MNIKDLMRFTYETSGTRRTTVKLDSVENAIAVFKQIMTQLLPDGHKLQINRDCEKAIDTLVRWIYKIEGVEADISKGILFKGPTGTGKTFLMRAFQKFLQIDQMSITCNGRESIMSLKIIQTRVLNALNERNELVRVEQYAKSPMLCLDDIGAEKNETRNYGNYHNIVAEIFDSRDYDGLLTFGTTNLNKLSDKYDDRTISRMKGCFNIIPICGSDLRDNSKAK